MKSIRTTLIAASLLVGLSGLALAQTAPNAKSDGPHAERMQKMHAKMGERHAQHLTELKAKLKLEAGQETAWTTFAQSMQAPMHTMAHPDRMAMDKLTTPERIDQMQAHKAARDGEMQKREDATKTFYAALNAEQKKVFDTETAKAMHKMGPQMGHGAGHHGHH